MATTTRTGPRVLSRAEASTRAASSWAEVQFRAGWAKRDRVVLTLADIQAARRRSVTAGCSTRPGVPQGGVLAVELDQLLMISELGDAPVDDHGNAVGVVGGV